MKEENPRRYAVAGLGEWGISEGLIYDRWEVKSFEKNNIGGADSWKYKHVFGLDYGYTNDPTAFIAMAVNTMDKILYVYDEHYEKKMQNSDIAAMIVKKGFQKERIRADSAEPKSNDDIRRLGISRIQPAAKGKDSILNGISRLQEYKMIIHPDCKNTIMELSSYIWDTKNEEAKNKPVDNNNHLMDAMRYAMQDVIYFKPEKGENVEARYKKLQRMSQYSGGGSIRPSDFKGGWG
jgi:phage terminase large subunit